jgi:hypothetical protein
MASALWKKIGDLYVNQNSPSPMFLLGITTEAGNWYIQTTTDGVNWFTDYADVFASQAAATNGLAQYVSNLNAGTAGP